MGTYRSGHDLTPKPRQNGDNVTFHEPSTAASVLAGDTAGITVDRPRVIVDVNLLLIREKEILLARRKGGFADGYYSLPAGHLELGEPVVAALIREAHEELGIDIECDDARFVQVMHNSYGIGRLAFFFEVKKWSGQARNLEPHKCEDIRWFSLNDLPGQMVPHIRDAIGHYIEHGDACLTLYGW